MISFTAFVSGHEVRCDSPGKTLYKAGVNCRSCRRSVDSQERFVRPGQDSWLMSHQPRRRFSSCTEVILEIDWLRQPSEFEQVFKLAAVGQEKHSAPSFFLLSRSSWSDGSPPLVFTCVFVVMLCEDLDGAGCFGTICSLAPPPAVVCMARASAASSDERHRGTCNECIVQVRFRDVRTLQ